MARVASTVFFWNAYCGRLVMDGFKAYKYYAALKLHFSSKSYNVFKNKGRVRYSRDKFMSRNDRYLFEKLGHRFASERDYIIYVAANMMYGNKTVVYDTTTGDANYQEYTRRRQAITNVFRNDMHTIANSGVQYDFAGQKVPGVIQLWLAGKITTETMVILDDLDGIVEKVKRNSHLALLFEDDLLVLEKSKGFVKYDSYKVMAVYTELIEDIKR